MSRPSASGRSVRVAFWTLGCRLNQYDTESMKAALPAGTDVQVVPWDQPADVYVLNSCTVTGRADQECRRLARQVKRRRPQAKVVVAGCYSQTQPEILAKIPEVDGVVGNTAKDDVGRWLPEVLAGGPTVVHVDEFAADESFSAPLIESFDGHSRAFVKVQDGCDLRCAYCLIWKARGPARSRSLAEVMTQLQVLADGGFPEVVLAGIHLGHYGRDFGWQGGLVRLLQEVVAAVPSLRIRLSSIHPNEVGPELVSLFERHGQLRPHLHLSLQSASDGVLRRMKRPYRSDTARRATAAVGRVSPHFGLGADIIVGFPGETETEFRETYDFVAERPFSYLHVFRYSPRPGTPAADMTRVMPETVTQRGRLLRELARRKQEEFAGSLVGLWREAVVEGEDPATGRQQATTDNYVTVLLPPGRTPGTVVRIRPHASEAGRLLADEVTGPENGECP